MLIIGAARMGSIIDTKTSKLSLSIVADVMVYRGDGTLDWGRKSDG